MQLEVIYPPQRTMRHFMLDEDKEFHLAGVQAYNDWLAKGFVGKAPGALRRPGPDPQPRHRGVDRRDAALPRRWGCAAW